MRREYPTQPIVGVGALIVHEGKLVLVKRGVQPDKGRWSIPGGAVELGERVRDAVLREAKEESGLDIDIKVNRPLDAIDNVLLDENGRLQFHYVLLQFLAQPKGGTLKPGGDVLDSRWVLLKDVEKYDLTEAFRSFFKKHRNELETL